MLIDASEVHPLNALEPMLVTPLGSEMLVKETSDWKADEAIVATELPRVIEDNKGLSPSANEGILVTLLPMVTVNRSGHALIAPDPRLVTLSGTVMLVNPLWRNAL